MNRRQIITLASLTLGSLAVGYALFAKQSDEERITALLDQLARGLSHSETIQNPVIYGAQLSSLFFDLMLEQVQVEVRDLHSNIPSDRQRIAQLAAQASSRYRSLDISFSKLDIRLAAGKARVTCTAHLVGSYVGEARRDTRAVVFELIKEGSSFLITSIHVEGES